MDSSDWSNGLRYHIFDTRLDRQGCWVPATRQSLASTKFRRDGSHFAIVWAIRLGIGRIRLAHTKAFVRAIRVGIGTGRLRDLAIRKWEPVSTKFRIFVGLPARARACRADIFVHQTVTFAYAAD